MKQILKLGCLEEEEIGEVSINEWKRRVFKTKSMLCTFSSSTAGFLEVASAEGGRKHQAELSLLALRSNI